MLASRIFDKITVEEYLEAENDGEHRHEYVYGEIYAMARASVNHNLVNEFKQRANPRDSLYFNNAHARGYLRRN